MSQPLALSGNWGRKAPAIIETVILTEDKTKIKITFSDEFPPNGVDFWTVFKVTGPVISNPVVQWSNSMTMLVTNPDSSKPVVTGPETVTICPMPPEDLVAYTWREAQQLLRTGLTGLGPPLSGNCLSIESVSSIKASSALITMILPATGATSAAVFAFVVFFLRKPKQKKSKILRLPFELPIYLSKPFQPPPMDTFDPDQWARDHGDTYSDIAPSQVPELIGRAEVLGVETDTLEEEPTDDDPKTKVARVCFNLGILSFRSAYVLTL